MSSVFGIVPTTQRYDWGKRGSSSAVARLAAKSLAGVDEQTPYAELWMGTHTSSPSTLSDDHKRPLSDHLKAHPELVGQRIIQRFDAHGHLPFLFKVLSIEKALSIQSHPDKKTAEALHAQYPDIYKGDPNHKPEMALAITPFHALCGFRPIHEIALFLRGVPELAALIPDPVLQSFLSSSSTTQSTPLKALFSSLMTAPKLEIKHHLRSLVERYNQRRHSQDQGETEDIVDLVLKLNNQFPDDIGVFCVFVLNYVVLSPGEAIFLGAGEPHAYISGDCMECMANSDNVIRAGLTPKLRDVPNLIKTLTYEPANPSKHLVHPQPFPSSSTGKYSTLYDPPVPEFSVVKVDVPQGERERHGGIGGPSVGIVVEGKGVVEWSEGGGGGEEREREVGPGDVVFVGAQVAVGIRAVERLVLYRAFVEV